MRKNKAKVLSILLALSMATTTMSGYGITSKSTTKVQAEETDTASVNVDINNPVQNNTVQCNTVQYNTVQNNTVQYNPIQDNGTFAGKKDYEAVNEKTDDKTVDEESDDETVYEENEYDEPVTVESQIENLHKDEGMYAPDSIVLSDTTKEEAQRIADEIGADIRTADDGNFAVLYLPKGTDIEDIYTDKDLEEDVLKMSPDYYVETSKIEDAASVMYTAPDADETGNNQIMPSRPEYLVNDSYYDNQDYLDYINLRDIWNYTRGGGIKVAVIDTGIDVDHPEFEGRISDLSYNASEDKKVSDYDLSVIDDEQGHGTAVAGVIAANMNNNKGITGVAPEVSLVVIKCDANESGEFVRGSDLLFGLAYAIEADVDVINMSFGTNVDPDNMYRTYTQLAVDSDIICIAAAGNDGSNVPVYPASLDSVIGVGAYDIQNDCPTQYSNYGDNVDMMAPGTTLTTTLDGKYDIKTGTSLAAPLVAGAAALYKSAKGKVEFSSMREIFEASSTDLGVLGADYHNGFGELDVHALVVEPTGTITYDMMTPELTNTTQLFVKGHTLQSMPQPERDSVVFDGWYKDVNASDECELYTTVFNDDITLYADWVNEDDGTVYSYVNNEDGTVEIRSYTGKRRYVTVPSEIEGKKVTSIGESAFADNNRIVSVILPEDIKSIGERAFAGCFRLRSINIPDSVTVIGDEAFKECARLSDVDISENSKLTKVGKKAFSFCAITEFYIPASLTLLGDYVFYGSTSIQKVSVSSQNSAYIIKNDALYNKAGNIIIYYPSAIRDSYSIDSKTTQIYKGAFAYSRSSEVVLNEELNTIGDEGFAYSKIRKVDFNKNLMVMGDRAFYMCEKLGAVSFAKEGRLEVIPAKAFDGDSNLTDITIPNYIKKIGDEAFSNCGIEKLVFEENSVLETIGNIAFSATSIDSVIIPASVEKIGTGAFLKGFGLATLVFEEGSKCESIGDDAFGYDYMLGSINLPDSLTSVGDRAFYQTGIKNLSIGSSLKDIGSGAFSACFNLESIEVNEANNVYTGFEGVLFTKDKSVLMVYPAAKTGVYIMPSEVTQIDEYAFAGAANLTTISMNEGLVKIGREAFGGCIALSTPALPSTLEEIDENAFANCVSMNTELIIPKNVNAIGRSAFYNDYSLRQISFEDDSKLSRIGYAAFAYSGIENLTVPAGVSSIGQAAFVGCRNLESVVFEKNSKLESLPAWSFEGASGIRSITFEDGSSLKNIQANACEGLLSLEVVDLSGCSRLQVIDNFAFQSCVALNNIELPDSLKEIGRYAFYGCKSFSRITIPENVSEIGRYAFSGTNDITLFFKAAVLPSNLMAGWDDGIGNYFVGISELSENDDWIYALTSDNKVSVVRYKGSASDVNLDKVDGHEVVSIGRRAFKDNETLSSITLPDTLTGIYGEAFSNTTALESIVIPENVAVIESEAFKGSSISKVTFAKGSVLRSIGTGAFKDTPNLESIVIPSQVTEIKNETFYNSGIKNVTLNENIVQIGRMAFAQSGLTRLTVPKSVEEISYRAFRDTESLATVSFETSDKSVVIRDEAFYNSGFSTISIPENIIYIGALSFAKCKKLTAINVAEGNSNYASKDGVFYDKSLTRLINCPAGKTGTYTISGTVKTISTGAFEGSKLSKIQFGNDSNVMVIGQRAFCECDNITGIDIPKSVISIEYYAFAYCDKLAQVNIDKAGQLGGIYGGAFYNCKKLNSITIPDNIQEISDYVFYGCDSLKAVDMSQNSKLQGVYDHAFEYSGIESFIMPKEMKQIGAYAFHGAKLKTFEFNDVLTDIGEYALADSELTETKTLVIPDSVENIGKGILQDVKAVEELSLPFLGKNRYDLTTASMSYVYGFTNGIGLNWENPKKVTITGESIIGSWAFEGMPVEEIVLSDSISKISDGAFARCPELKKATLPSGLETIPLWLFLQDYKLEEVNIPDACTVIEQQAFEDCQSLKSISIPAGITTIKEDAFIKCNALNKITIDKNNKYYKLVDGILYDKSGTSLILAPRNLTKTITIPDGVVRVSGSAFSGCGSIENVIMPDSVKCIGNNAFEGCTELSQISWSKNLETIGEWAFRESGLKEAILPDKVVSVGKYTFGLCSKLVSVSIPDGVTVLESSLFWGDESLEEVSIGNKVTFIGNGCFTDCIKLKKIQLPATLTTIEDYAFNGCAALATVTIPKSVMKIGQSVFTNCNNLKELVVEKGNKNYATKDGILYDASYEILLSAPAGIEGEVIIPNGVKSIETDAFANNTKITSIIIPDSVEVIKPGVFSGCEKLKDITLSNNIWRIGNNAFSGTAYSGENSNYSDNILYIGGYAVGTNPMCDFQSITGTIILKEGTILLADNLFNSTNFDEIIMPDTLKYIGEHAFYGNEKLRRIRWSSNIEYIGDEAFRNCDLNCVELYNSDIKFGKNSAFGENDRLDYLRINRDVLYDYNEESETTKAFYPYTGKLVTYIGVYSQSQYNPVNNEDYNPQNIVLENGTQVLNSELPKSGAKVFTRTTLDFGGFDEYELAGNEIYYAGEWNLTTFMVDGMTIMVLPIRSSQLVQEPASDLVSEFLPKGAAFIGWDINGDGKADQLPTTLSSDLNATAVYDAPVMELSIVKNFYGDSLNLGIGEQMSLKVDYNPRRHNQDDTVVWTSSDDKSVTVDNQGNIKVVGSTDGEYVTIKAALKENKSVYDELRVYVDIAKYGIFFDRSGVDLNPGDTYLMEPNISLPSGYDGTVTYKSQDPKIATVDNKGNIKAVSAGTTNIIVSCGKLYKVIFTVNITSNIIINIKEITNATVTGIKAAAYTGKAITQSPVVKVDGVTLVKNTDYTLSYKNNTNVGTATITIKGIGVYSGTITKTFKINAVNLSKAKAAVTGIKAKTYTGKNLTQSITLKVGTVTLKNGTDYTVSYKNNKNAGTATLTIKGKGNYTGSINKTFKINAKKITPAVTLKASAYTFTGKTITPAVTVKTGRVTLKKGTDYTVTYATGRKNVGTYKVTVKMKGNYSGSKTVSFKINPKGTSLKNVTSRSKGLTVKWNKQAGRMATGTITGYQIQLATNSSFTAGKKTVNVNGVNNTSKVVIGLSGNKRYYVRIRTYMKVGNVTYYSGWSKAKNGVTER